MLTAVGILITKQISRGGESSWNHLMCLRDMKYIGFKHQRENKQNSDKTYYCIMFDSLEICLYLNKNYLIMNTK
jgi:hypothetical protein